MIHMPSSRSWYERIPPVERQSIDALAKWIRPIDWQLFCTFEFSGKVSRAQGLNIFRSFIDDLERTVRSRVCFVRGDEIRSAEGSKSATPLHFHALMTAQARLEPDLVKTLWWRYGGRGHDGSTADVQLYERGVGGEEYCLKFSRDSSGDWWHRNLGFFMPGTKGHPTPKHKAQRALSRFKARGQL